MPVADNKAEMRRVLKAYGEGDVAPVLALLHPEIVWVSQAPPRLFRFGGTHRGQAEAVAGISTIAADYTLHRYDILELVGEDEIVWMNARLDLTERKSGCDFAVSLAARWQFRDGKVIALTEYFDSAAVALVQGNAAVALRV